MLLFVFFSVLSIVASENEVIMRPWEGSFRRMLFWNVWKSLPYNCFSTICLSDCWVFVCWLFWRWWWSGQFKSWLLRSGCFLQIPLSFGGDLAAWKAALLMFLLFHILIVIVVFSFVCSNSFIPWRWPCCADGRPPWSNSQWDIHRPPLQLPRIFCKNIFHHGKKEYCSNDIFQSIFVLIQQIRFYYCYQQVRGKRRQCGKRYTEVWLGRKLFGRGLFSISFDSTNKTNQ